MPIAITVPRLGWNMDEGTFVGWLKQDGEPIQPGDPLFSLEGEKATQDIEALDAGTLHILPSAPAAGDRILVGVVIGYLLQPGEAEPTENAGTPAPDVVHVTARREPASLLTSAPRSGRTRISPLARRIARELGVDWSGLRGSGRTGRIRKADILEAAQGPQGNGASAPTESIPISAIRRTIAERLLASQRTTVPVTLTTTVDATNLVNLRGQFRAASGEGGEIPSYTDFLIKLTTFALQEHPRLMARWEGDRLIVPREPHIGIAVDTDAGLLVPVIRDPGRLGLTEIAARSRDLVARARAQQLPASELTGGTFTITNLGAYGIETFTPVINPPECAILGVGRIVRQPVCLGEQVVGRERMFLSLTFDHRIVDGAPAARFLQRLGQLIENPGPWLIR